MAADRAFAALPPPLPNWLQTRRVRNEIRVRIADARSKLGRLDEAQKDYLGALADREELAGNAPRPASAAALLQPDVGQRDMYLGDFRLMMRQGPGGRGRSVPHLPGAVRRGCWPTTRTTWTCGSGWRPPTTGSG